MCESHPYKLTGSENLILKPTNRSCQIKCIKIRKFKLLFYNPIDKYTKLQLGKLF